MTDDRPDGLPTADDIQGHADGSFSISADDFGADTDDSPPETPEDTATDIEDGMRLISADVSCQNCAHKDVCSLLQGIQPMLASWEPGEPPIDLQELAVICEAYLPEDEVGE